MGPPGLYAQLAEAAECRIVRYVGSQEVQRMQRILLIVRTNLSSMVNAIDGTVIMTPDLQDDVTAVFDLRVPRRWTRDPSGAEISWLSPTLGKWFSGMRLRVEQLCTWLEKGRPKSFWLTGFFNPTGFLTGMMQEVRLARSSQGLRVELQILQPQCSPQESNFVSSFYPTLGDAPA